MLRIGAAGLILEMFQKVHFRRSTFCKYKNIAKASKIAFVEF